jgi:hypothetical protein
MINVKLNYIMLQAINVAFAFLAYLYVREHFHPQEERSLAGFLTLLPVIMAAVWAFFTNRIFYILAKRD